MPHACSSELCTAVALQQGAEVPVSFIAGITLYQSHLKHSVTRADILGHSGPQLKPVQCAAGNTPQALLVCPIFHPENPSQPIGVLQCFNKRSRVGSFSELDQFTIRLLTRYIAAAAVNADRFNIEYRLDLYARRIFDLTENIASENELSELPGRIFSRAKELLSAHRARLYFVAPGDGPVENRLVQSPFVVCFTFGRVAVCAFSWTPADWD